MNTVDEVYDFVMEKITWYKNTSQDNYDFWNEHIKYVYNESTRLAKKYNANLEIVQLGALLHDIALIYRVGTKSDHHINGRDIAKDILTNFKYPKEKIEKVLGCVYNHRNSKNANNIEELCLADADVLAHFDNIPMIFDVMFNVKKMKLADIHEEIKKYLEKDYNDLSERTKEEFKEKYNKIKEVLIVT